MSKKSLGAKFTRQRLDVISPQSEPGERREVVGDLHRELGDVVVGRAQGDDRRRQGPDRNVPEVVAVDVQPDQPLEGAEEFRRNLSEVVAAEKEGRDGVLEASRVFVDVDLANLVAGIRRDLLITT